MDEVLITLQIVPQQQNIIDAVQNYGKRLFSFIRSRVKNDEDAKDILQDVWFQLSSIIDTEPIGQLSSWLYRVTRNRIIDKGRKKKSQLLQDLTFEDENGEMIYPEALLADGRNPEMELEKKNIMESLFEALRELPENQRNVFVWNELEDMTLQEIADKTGENIKTIISRKRYAIAHLRLKLQNIYKELMFRV